jgi:hypothetical protein
MGRPRKEFPQLWTYPHDRVANAKHLAWSRSKAQAKFRGDDFLITEEEWMTLVWPTDLWLRRGRRSEDLCLVRDDPKGAWSVDNVMIVTRRAQLILQQSNPTLYEMEPNIWDITGDSLTKWEKNQKISMRYRGRYTNKGTKNGN